MGDLHTDADQQRQRDQQTAALAAFGVQPDWSDHDAAAAVQTPVRLWPENAPSWHLFLRAPWCAGFGALTALDWVAIDITQLQPRQCRRLRRTRARLLADLQACEAGALSGWTERRKRETR